MFSTASWSSISLATVTPSLVIVGDPNFFSMTTLRPFGPSVTLTASASLLTPWRIRWRASSPYEIVLAAIFHSLLQRLLFFTFDLLLNNGEHFVFAQDQVLFVVDLDFGAGILADEDAVPLLHVERELLAILVDLALADGHDFGFHGLLLGGVGDDDPPLAGFLFFESFDENPVIKRSNLHSIPPDDCWIARRTS